MREYSIRYSDQFLKDLELHRKAGKSTVLNKLNDLINELRIHPRFGTGKPEQLKGNFSGLWSRRLTQKHRLVYSIEEDIVTVILISAYGHYED